LQFTSDVKVYTYHILYTGSDLVADIGGYLGLFLGLSLFGCVELLGKVVSKFEVKKETGRKCSTADE
jgi:hypothetical protein